MNDFFASLYEVGGLITIGQNASFSFDLYLNELYPVFGLISWGSSLIALIFFYFIINHPRVNRWFHWVIIAVTIALINGIVSFTITTNKFGALGLDYGLEHFYFAIINILFTLASITFFTFIFRVTRFTELSRNCSTCPFPN